MVLQLHAWDVHEHPHLGDPTQKPYGNGSVLWFESEHVEVDYARAVQQRAKILEPLHINPRANHLEFWLQEPSGYIVVVASPYGDLGGRAPSAA